MRSMHMTHGRLPFVRPMLLLLLGILGATAPATSARAQGGSGDGEPCCAITAIDRRSGVVTAAEAGTGRTFRFEVTAAQLRGLKVGQKVWADFGTQKVSVDGAAPCCGMIGVAGTAAGHVKGAVDPGEPCCGITAIDARSGVVTARVSATGRTFRFTVTDAATLQSLRAGQGVWADFATKKVRIYGAAPCCSIVTSDVRQE